LKGRIGGVLVHFPIFVGVEKIVIWIIGLQEEGGSQRHLCERDKLAEIPNDGCDGVFAFNEVGSDIDGLETPVHKVAASRPTADALAVDEEAIAVVGGNMDDEFIGYGIEVKGPAEMVHAEILG